MVLAISAAFGTPFGNVSEQLVRLGITAFAFTALIGIVTALALLAKPTDNVARYYPEGDNDESD